MGLQYDELIKVTEAKDAIASVTDEFDLARYDANEARGKSDAMHTRLLQAQSVAAGQNLLPCGSEARDMDALLKDIDMPKAAHQVAPASEALPVSCLTKSRDRHGMGIHVFQMADPCSTGTMSTGKSIPWMHIVQKHETSFAL